MNSSDSQNGDAQNTRRRFLQSAGVLSGALVLGRVAHGADEPVVDEAAAPELVLKFSENAELEKAGGWKIVEVGAQSVIVANTGEGYVACSAICTHKGCKVGYEFAARQFVCPCHKARFDESGKVVKGPAKTDLAQFNAQAALVVSAKKSN